MTEAVNLEALFLEGLRKIHAEEEGDEILAWARRRLDVIGGDTDVALMTWAESFDFTDAMLKRYEELAKLSPEQRKVLDYPWSSWNKVIRPLAPGMLATVTAPDGMGKSTYAECLADHWAAHHRYVVYVHYELNKEIMMQRRLARHARVPVAVIADSLMTPEQKRSVAEVRPRLTQWAGQINYLHTPGWTMERTVEAIRKLQGDGLCDVVVIDYLEKVAASTRQMKMRLDWYQREADNVETLKNFAEASGIPVVMVAQMTKAGKGKDKNTVDRTDVKGAGEKTDKANLVVLLSRKRENDGYADVVDVLIDKNTMGKAGAQFQQYMTPEYFDVRDLQ
jgi:replicative DNA helicase